MKHSRKKLIAIGVIVAIVALALYFFLPSTTQAPIFGMDEWLVVDEDVKIRIENKTVSIRIHASITPVIDPLRSDPVYEVHESVYGTRRGNLLHLRIWLTSASSFYIHGTINFYNGTGHHKISWYSPHLQHESDLSVYPSIACYVSSGIFDMNCTIVRIYVEIYDETEVMVASVLVRQFTLSFTLTGSASWAEWIANWAISPTGVGVIAGAVLAVVGVLVSQRQKKSRRRGERKRRTRRL